LGEISFVTDEIFEEIKVARFLYVLKLIEIKGEYLSFIDLIIIVALRGVVEDLSDLRDRSRGVQGFSLR
jgi:hypothetical protein